jgi:hypothetical protein
VKPLRIGSDAYITSKVSKPEDNSSTHEQAVRSPGDRTWEEAMNVELACLKQMGGFEKSELLLRETTLPSMPVLSCKKKGVLTCCIVMLLNVAKHKEQCAAKRLKQEARRGTDEVLASSRLCHFCISCCFETANRGG